ncbi:MAG: tyrosine-type recombinase/integrase [Rhabdaerophilum sp.]
MTLTDTAIKNLKANGEKQKISDGGGLQLWISPSGTKSWRFAYRFNGTQKDIVLGQYPVVGLADARKRRDEAKALLATGIDPGQQRKLNKITKAIADAATFEAVAEEYLAKKIREGMAASTVKRLRSQLRYVIPVFGKRPISEITTVEVLDPLKRIDAKGIHETATRTKELCGAIFRYGMATGRRTDDPTQALHGALTSHRVKHRAAILDAVDFGALLRAIEDFDGQPTTKMALKLLPLVFTRPGELRNAEWSEFNLDNAVWIIPAGRMKMRREHHVPLSRQALDILKTLQALTGKGKLLFPGNRSYLQPISENTLNAALRRMGYTKEQMTAHGFRGSASTLLNESGKFSPDAIERALAHQDSDEIRRAYNRGAYWNERVTMSQWWADHLDVLKEGGKIIELSSKHRTKLLL